ncbi:rCG32008 [Rattus norvegicus]|uniref:RCG32008 n=1 Tax=Rattus norvegicus TaxID=10116 RepID=A6KDP6_RAT|nr:rCG32008 [Rattus norvegicus]
MRQCAHFKLLQH